ncbi:DUF2846 domain-containing protein [Geothrix oryzisoli]|uniref:DUF2846 domain-containing protein n=1 Tax=Geothrix oryzisoli TaxID=2922721 RepID=UPI001FAC5091|nr:DUF2846 domain-containing protein [Geothrix oryzisoli]
MRSTPVLLSALLSLALGAQTPPSTPPPPEAPKTEPPAKPSPEPAPAPMPKPQETPTPAAPETKPMEAAKPAEAPAPAEAAKPVETVKAPESAGKAILLFYRESRFVGGALRPSIYVDGVEVAYLSSGSYLKVAVAPGDHGIYADKKDDQLMFPVEAGKTYYFRVGIRAGLFKGHGKVEPVSEEAGAKEFEAWKPKLTYTEKILKPEMVVKD